MDSMIEGFISDFFGKSSVSSTRPTTTRTKKISTVRSSPPPLSRRRQEVDECETEQREDDDTTVATSNTRNAKNENLSSFADKTTDGREGAACAAVDRSNQNTGNELGSILSFGSSSDGFDRVFRQEVPSIDVDVDQLGVVHVFSSPSLVKTVVGVGAAVAVDEEQREEQGKYKRKEEEMAEGIEVDFNYSTRTQTIAGDNTDDNNTTSKRNNQNQRSGGLGASGTMYRHQDEGQEYVDESRGIYASSFGSLLNDTSKDDLECVGISAGGNDDDEKEEPLVEPLSVNSTLQNRTISTGTKQSTLPSCTSNKIHSHHHTFAESNSCPSDEDFDNDSIDDNEPDESTISERSEPSSIYDFFRSNSDHIVESNQLHSLFDDDEDDDDDDETTGYPFETMETIIEEEYGGSWESSISAEEEIKRDANHDAISRSERTEIESNTIRAETPTKDTQRKFIETTEGEDNSTESQLVMSTTIQQCMDDSRQVQCIKTSQIDSNDLLVELQHDELHTSLLKDDDQRRRFKTEKNAASVDSSLNNPELRLDNRQIFPMAGFLHRSIKECIRHSVDSTHIKDATTSFESSIEDQIGIIFERSLQNTVVATTSANQMIQSNIPGVQFVGLSMLLARSRSVQISGK